ncbi:Ribosomal RNA small subunit methyltransferase, mitochondrial [Vitis vinifera]|uniref:rRNA adenine N(6)-methyltransferase n=1 Tax=Vitis vinifera TaxID=29760 RepID=A0A438K6H4_VITVI|nr:Ribosomal RNA small subunit methyltransferase, mitochondrial [Vitis vinifera]
MHGPSHFRRNLTGFVLRRHLLHTKPGRRYVPRNDDVQKKDNGEKRMFLYKSWGQHILTNPRVLDTIVRKSNIKPTDTVLEIGPGTGNLTLRLLQAAQRVVAVELDARMVEILRKRVAEHGLEDQLTVICKDALKTDFPQFDLVVANIPYGISSPLVAKLVFGANPFRSATLLLQKEFARRLLANPGDSEFNRLAVNVKLVAEVEFVMDVSKRDFLPCPKVDSSVVTIRPKAEVPDVDLNEWCAFTRTCFSKKNKTLGATFKHKRRVMELWRLSNLRGSETGNAVSGCNYDCSYDEDKEEEEGNESDEGNGDPSPGSEMEMSLFKEKINGVLKLGGFDDKRPAKLSGKELLQLLSLFNQAGIHFHDQAKPRNADNIAVAASYST